MFLDQQYSKRYVSMTDPFEVMIWTFCLQMVSVKRLRIAFLTWVNHMSEMRAFKVQLIIAFSKFYPSSNQTDL